MSAVCVKLSLSLDPSLRAVALQAEADVNLQTVVTANIQEASGFQRVNVTDGPVSEDASGCALSVGTLNNAGEASSPDISMGVSKTKIRQLPLMYLSTRDHYRAGTGVRMQIYKLWYPTSYGDTPHQRCRFVADPFFHLFSYWECVQRDAGARMSCGSAIGSLLAKRKLMSDHHLIGLRYSYLSEVVLFRGVATRCWCR